jgi:hypothetical protein
MESTARRVTNQTKLMWRVTLTSCVKQRHFADIVNPRLQLHAFTELIGSENIKFGF